MLGAPLHFHLGAQARVARSGICFHRRWRKPNRRTRAGRVSTEAAWGSESSNAPGIARPRRRVCHPRCALDPRNAGRGLLLRRTQYVRVAEVSPTPRNLLTDVGCVSFTVFLEPSFLISLLKPLFEHRLSTERRRGSIITFSREAIKRSGGDKQTHKRLETRIDDLVNEGTRMPVFCLHLFSAVRKAAVLPP